MGMEDEPHTTTEGVIMGLENPATKIVHWASGPVNCCERHAEQLAGLGNFLGHHIAVTDAEEDAECSNCINESKNHDHQ